MKNFFVIRRRNPNEQQGSVSIETDINEGLASIISLLSADLISVSFAKAIQGLSRKQELMFLLETENLKNDNFYRT